MPLVDAVVGEFADEGVRLVGVNMQEDPETVAAAAQRLGMAQDVVLDIDGATTEKYEVTAIPQTVVIDAEGRVAGLFIGGGAGLANQLRSTLKDLVAGESPGS